jgi:hypothetical protein
MLSGRIKLADSVTLMRMQRTPLQSVRASRGHMPTPLSNSRAKSQASPAGSDSVAASLRSQTRAAMLWRRPLVGSVSGLIAGIALAVSLHNTFLGLILGALVGSAYALVSRSNATLSVENVFTAAALAFPLWTVLNTILIPAISGCGPQYLACRKGLPGTQKLMI